jgi:DNA-directed RNA polymerase beta subunit
MSNSILDSMTPPAAPEQPFLPPTPEIPDSRRFADAPATRKLLYDNALQAARDMAPVSNALHTLALTDVHYADPDKFSLATQKQAILGRGSPGRRLRGTFVLTGANGQETARRKVTLGTVPHLTERGTFIHNGTEYSMAHQLRLLPGVFTREKANGEIEAHVNVAKGLGHRISLEPSTGIFTMQIGQAQLPLFPLLKTLGLSEKAIRDAWGNELTAANMQKDDPKKIQALYKRLCKYSDPNAPYEAQEQSLREVFERMEIDPVVTQRTLGQPFTRVTPDTLLAVTKKLIAVNRRESEVDDRDDMAYQRILGPEDIFAERIKRDRGTLQKLLWKASARGNLEHLIPGMFNGALQSALLTSGLGQSPEEVNPAELLDHQTRVTRLGEGGLSSEAVPQESRVVHASQLALVDFLRTPESTKSGIDLRMAVHTRKGPNGKLYAQLQDMQGRTVYKTPQDLVGQAVAFPNELRRNSPYVAAVVNGKIKNVPRAEVAFELPYMEHAFSPLGNLVPLKSLVKGQRAIMSSRMIAQALPLIDPEAPLVQNAMPERPDRSYEEEYSRYMGALYADKPGKVESVTPDGIVVRRADGNTETHELYNHFPSNRKTYWHQTPAVRPGDVVQPGQLLAKSNYTDAQGTMAIGRNLRAAYIPFRGLNHEDATVISESAAKRLVSEHMYQHGLDLDDSTVRTDKSYFRSMFPGKFDRKILANFDERGVIKPGTTVQPGEPLVLVARKRAATAKQVHRKLTPIDESILWEHHNPGLVTDVDVSPKGINVIVKSTAQMQVGDKLAGRHGNKMVVSAIIPDGEMPHGADGRPFEVLMDPLSILSRTNPAQVIEVALGKIAEKTGKPYKVPDFDDQKDLAAWALEECRKHGISDLEDITDPTTDRKISGVLAGNIFMMKLHHQAEHKLQGRGLGAYTMDMAPAKGGAAGCFTAKQQIVTIRGSMDIAAICEKQLGVQVRTFSPQLQEWVYRPVIDWFIYRANIDDIVTIETIGGPCEKTSRVNRTRSCLYATRNHEIFEYTRGRIPVSELRQNDQLITWGLLPTAQQWAFLYGTMLGDATVDNNAVSCEHSIKQSAYLQWKRKILGGLCPGSCDSVHGDGRGKRKRHHSRVLWINEDHVCATLQRTCYDDNHIKRVTVEWLQQLSDLSVAAWVLDDGSITNRAKKKGRVHLTGKLCTMGFDNVSCQLLLDWLNTRYATTCTLGQDKNICLSADACRKLAEIVAQWVPAAAIPGSKPFLRRFVADAQHNLLPRPIDSVSRLGLVPMRIASIRPYRHDKAGITEVNVYDITVADTHTYIAGQALVANSKRLGLLESGALLSYGSTQVLRDMKLLRGQANPDYWAQYMQGHKPATPRVPVAYEKFINQLRASGIHPVRTNERTQIMALTSRDVEQLAGDREIKGTPDGRGGLTLETVDWKDLSPVPGGLFDPATTGGHGGRNWAYIALPYPVPNPAMEDPIRRMLGLTEQQFQDIIGNKLQLNGTTGPQAIGTALANINVDKEIERCREDIRSAKKSRRDIAVRRLGYLKSAQELQLHPREWMLDKVPVLPPFFRPVSTLGAKKLPLVDDANLLYKELFDSVQLLKQAQEQLGDNVGEEHQNVYNAFKGVVGLGDPIHPKNRERNVRGILREVFSHSPKFGSVQRRLLGGSVDLVGRAVIVPDPELDMDTVGLPEDKAWEIYKPFVIRNLRRNNVPTLRANALVEDRSPTARKALLEEMESRPVIINRAPTLHRFGLMAAKPQLAKGDVLRISPLIIGGLSADFDGDSQFSHVFWRCRKSKLDVIMRTSTKSSTFLQEHKMSARFKVALPHCRGYDVFLTHLQDFPHGELLHRTRGQHGPIDWFAVPEDVEVLAHCPVTGAAVWRHPTVWSVHRDCPMIAVTLQSGRQIFTDDDPRAVYGVACGTLALTRARPQDALSRKFMVPRAAHLASLEHAELQIVRPPLPDTVQPLWLKPQIALDEDFGYLCGCAVGDGWTTRLRGVIRDFSLAGISGEVQEKIARIIASLFAGDGPKGVHIISTASYGHSQRITYNSVTLARLLAPMIGHTAEAKHLPGWFLAAPRAARMGLFAGCMDTDGSISIARAKGKKPQLMSGYSSRSLRLVQEVRLLAASLGIRGRITPSNTPAGLPFWQLSFANGDIAKWGGAVMVHTDKLQKLRSIVVEATPAAVRHDLIPVSFELAKWLTGLMYTPKNHKKWPAGQEAIYMAFMRARHSGYVTRQSAERITKFVDVTKAAMHPEWELWQNIVGNTDITWEQVANVEVGEQCVTGYDLTVPGPETFMDVDGVFLSNTMQFHVPGTDEAAQEALEKMLPSSNLFSPSTFQVHQTPGKEYTAGLYEASGAIDKKNKPVHFATVADAVRAYRQGKINVDRQVVVHN